MSKPSASEHEFHGMMKHLDSLYAMAQVLTLDAEKASLLVEDTFQRALRLRERNLVFPGDRRHLLQLLIQVFNEQKNTPPPIFETTVPEIVTSASSRESFKQNILDQFLSRAVPASFAMMEDLDRVVLSLCEASRLSNADVALVLGGDSDAVSVQLKGAKQRLQEKVLANAPPAILDILKDGNSDEWMSKALNRAIKSEFNTIPPTLEPKIQSAFTQHNPEAARQALAKSSGKQTKDVSKRLSHSLMTVFLILTAGFLGYIGSSLFTKEYDGNLLTLSASNAPRIETVHATADLSEAEHFVMQQMHWRLSLPNISNGALTGVGISEIADKVRVPVFLYRDDAAPNKEYIAIYAFTYALLDEFADRIQLEGDILTAIADEDSFDLHDLNDNQKFVIWRNSDDIFMAVTSSNPLELRDRITVK